MMKRGQEEEINYGASNSGGSTISSSQNDSESEDQGTLGSQQSETLQCTTSNNVPAPSPYTDDSSREVKEALRYLDQVKYKFNDQPEKFTNFLNIMKEFKSGSIDRMDVVRRMCNLFQGHIELIYGFNQFLPLRYQIEIQYNDQGIAVPVISGRSLPRGA